VKPLVCPFVIGTDARSPRIHELQSWLFVQLYRWFPSILQAIAIIRPEALARWHRAGFGQ
jgi:hypothetical protein